MVKADLKEVPIKKEEIKDSDYTAIIIRDFHGNVDPFYLSKKDPNYAYRFLRDDSKNISLKTGNLLFFKGGWQICPKKHLLKLGLKEEELSSDGFYRVGDTILAFMPKALFEEKEKEKQRRANEPMETVERLLKKGNPSIGGKDIHPTMKGIQTQEDLKMK